MLPLYFYRNVFQDVLHQDTLVKAFLDQVTVRANELKLMSDISPILIFLMSSFCVVVALKNTTQVVPFCSILKRDFKEDALI